MKFIISTKDLHNIISKLQHVVPVKPTVPVVANILIEADNDELIFTATDLMISVRHLQDATIEEEGATTLPAKLLAVLVRELTAPNVTLSTNATETTTITSGTSLFKLHGMRKDLFPSFPDLVDAYSFSLKQKDLKEALAHITFAASKDDNLYTLNAILMHAENNHITFAAIDGKRLARSLVPVDFPDSFTSRTIIPIKAIEELLPHLGEVGDILVSIGADKIAFKIEQTLLVTKILEGNYPDISLIIPQTLSTILSVHREELTQLLRQIALFRENAASSVRFLFSPGELQLLGNTMEVGEGDVEMPLDYQGPPLEISFNPGFFLDVLRHCKEEVITIGLTDGYNPAVIVDGVQSGNLNESPLLFVIMPMSLP